MARFSPSSAVPLLRAQLLLQIMDLLEGQVDIAVVQAALLALQWLLSAGGQDLWMGEDDDDAEPLYTGEVRGRCVCMRAHMCAPRVRALSVLPVCVLVCWTRSADCAKHRLYRSLTHIVRSCGSIGCTV